MKYVLVKDNHVFAGPNDWRPSLFKSYIEDDFEIEMELPQVAPLSGTNLGNGIAVYTIDDIQMPAHNPKIQNLSGPYYTFTVNSATQYFTPSDKPIAQVQRELKEIVANSRWKREIAGTSATIQGQELKLTTVRGDRDIFLQALQLGGPDKEWKLTTVSGDSIWLTLTASDLQIIVDAIVSYIQSAFTWEKSVIDQIDTPAIDLATLDSIDIGLVSNNPILN